ncbi:hypothetical protein DOTSEDRAFT_87369 [Dothistroma septosporum NZE10]|uniref:5'-3' DNA helicase ZGRF1-like N-terminal domain-containing protein n=1 Tax=Dothistroma septosporum (strain NZE10 / CBS 128990) TaxID=675120 RepID=N1PN53_DOTSN|nr:hypothetical protein DOTSEDRAFT_87369 [Dothistroma septosporum NZE10]
MTAAVFRNTPSLSIPPTQNTAPVLDFNCLYTHDVKKKAKKWQDGLLRYHTFNKRVMVYDEGRNLVGDMHWAGEEAVQEGHELRLERVAVMVEVGDSTGQTETDLTELRKSRKKDSGAAASSTNREAGISIARATPTPSGRPLSTALSRANTQLKHKSLNALLGTPKGPIGKAALPQKSPFEERRAQVQPENEEWEDGRPPKRQRNAAPDWILTRTTKASKASKQNEQPLFAKTADTATQKKASLQAGQEQFGAKEVIVLSDDAQSSNIFLPGFSDEVLAHSSSPPRRKEPIAETTNNIVVRSSSPAFQTQQSKPSKTPRAALKEKQKAAAPKQDTPPIDPTAKQTSDMPAKTIRSGRFPSSDTEDQRTNKARHSSAATSRPASTRTGQILRLAASVPKKRTLLCQDQLIKDPKIVSSNNADSTASALRATASDGSEGERPTAALTKLQARLAKIEKKKGSTSSARLGPAKQKSGPIELDCDTDTGERGPGDFSDDEIVDEELPRPRTSHETSAIELGRFDSMMLPPAKPAAESEARPRSKPSAPAASRVTPQHEVRPFRRVLSESDTGKTSKPKRVAGAPIRYTPTSSPTKRSRESTPLPAAAENQKQSVSRLATASGSRASRQKKPLQKSVSLNMTSDGTSRVMLSKPFQAPGISAKTKAKEPEVPKDVGPWSREVFDLFTWRPPKWDEEKWCINVTLEVAPSRLR